MITDSPAYVGLTKTMKAMHGPVMDRVIKHGSDLGFNLIIDAQMKLTKIRDNYFKREMER